MSNRGKNADDVLQWLRALTEDWLGVEEGRTSDQPCFRVGKSPFATLLDQDGEERLCLKIEPEARAALLEKTGWSPSPHDPNEREACRRIADLDFPETAPLVLASYRLAAPGRIRKTWES